MITNPLEVAEEFKKAAFAKLDSKRKNPSMATVNVDANKLIDVCIAFESAAKGDFETQEYNLKFLRKQVEEMRNAFDKLYREHYSNEAVREVAEKYSW